MISLLATMLLYQFARPERNVIQDRNAWVIDYRFSYQGDKHLTLSPSDLKIKIEGQVSNSRLKPHSYGRKSLIETDGSEGATRSTDVIESSDSDKRCREELKIWIGVNELNLAKGHEKDPLPINVLTVKPGDTLYLRLSLSHDHIFYGDYDVLLGKRQVVISLAEYEFKDVWDFWKEQFKYFPPDTWAGQPLPERRDDRMFISKPDSLYLDASVPGDQYYRFPERKVRPATRMRLSFYYYVARGSTGEFKFRIAQYRESTSSWKVIAEGAQDVKLPVVGQWTKVEKVIPIHEDTNSMALDFRFVTPGEEIGNAWIDDVFIDCIEAPSPNP